MKDEYSWEGIRLDGSATYSKSEWETNPANVGGPNDNVLDNNAWATKRDTWAEQMWQTRHVGH
jgi:hypothetical protein